MYIYIYIYPYIDNFLRRAKTEFGNGYLFYGTLNQRNVFVKHLCAFDFCTVLNRQIFTITEATIITIHYYSRRPV